MGKRIKSGEMKRLRTELGMTQEEFAVLIGSKAISVIRKAEQQEGNSRIPDLNDENARDIVTAFETEFQRRGRPLTRGQLEELLIDKADVLPAGCLDRPLIVTGPGTVQGIRALSHHNKFPRIKDPTYYGPIPQAKLVIAGRKAELVADEVTFYKDADLTLLFAKGCVTATGLTSRNYAYLVYSFKDDERNLSWDGVMAINVPASGDLHGFWLTEGQTEYGRLVIGSLQIERD